jgi:hypothetical protein
MIERPDKFHCSGVTTVKVNGKILCTGIAEKTK